MSTYVITISGPSGAGKSTLLNNLVNLFGDAFSLGIDDYPDDHYPPAVRLLERGANPDEFETPQFFADICPLKEGNPSCTPIQKLRYSCRRISSSKNRSANHGLQSKAL